jgi:hypothetical protein
MSAVLSVLFPSKGLLKPAGTSTRPSASLAAEVVWRGLSMGPVGAHVLVTGSYSSARLVRTLKSQVAGGGPVQVRPPATRTLPALGPVVSNAAECRARRVIIGGVGVQVPVAGL